MNVNIIEARLSSIDNIRYEQVARHKNAVLEDISKIKDLLQHNSIINPMQLIITINISDMNGDDVRRWFMNLKLNLSLVYVYWVGLREGIQIPLDMFINYYDDLWFPGLDDIWITNDSTSVILELNHEEVISLWQKVSG